MKHFYIGLLLLLLIPFQALSKPLKEYYESGALRVEETYKNRKEEEVHKNYYESGALKAKGGQLVSIPPQT